MQKNGITDRVVSIASRCNDPLFKFNDSVVAYTRLNDLLSKKKKTISIEKVMNTHTHTPWLTQSVLCNDDDASAVNCTDKLSVGNYHEIERKSEMKREWREKNDA